MILTHFKNLKAGDLLIVLYKHARARVRVCVCNHY